MTLAFARAMSPETPYLMAALIGGRRRPRQRPGAKDWLRIANRLAAGLPPRAAALPEGGDETLVERLLEREEFRAFVDGQHRLPRRAARDPAPAPGPARPPDAGARADRATMRRSPCSSSRRSPTTATRP